VPLIGANLPVLIAPMGASAVLLFAVPSSPLAQPWSILGGNVVSAVTGVLIFKIFGHSALALGVAVACAILAMSLLRCPHPPGGAVAMTAVIGGPAIWHAGFAFPFDVVALNSFVLIATG
jgi:CBS domain-containing membrane protein